MGSTLSLCNATPLILNLALSQVGPLFYENQVLPGECWVQRTGKVWFTIEARPYLGDENKYTNAERVLPIIGVSLMGIGVAGGAAGAAGAVGAASGAAEIAGFGATGITSGVAAGDAKLLDSSIKPHTPPCGHEVMDCWFENEA
jgi:hypothetical protein